MSSTNCIVKYVAGLGHNVKSPALPKASRPQVVQRPAVWSANSTARESLPESSTAEPLTKEWEVSVAQLNKAVKEAADGSGFFLGSMFRKQGNRQTLQPMVLW